MLRRECIPVRLASLHLGPDLFPKSPSTLDRQVRDPEEEVLAHHRSGETRVPCRRPWNLSEQKHSRSRHQYEQTGEKTAQQRGKVL